MKTARYDIEAANHARIGLAFDSAEVKTADERVNPADDAETAILDPHKAYIAGTVC